MRVKHRQRKQAKFTENQSRKTRRGAIEKGRRTALACRREWEGRGHRRSSANADARWGRRLRNAAAGGATLLVCAARGWFLVRYQGDPWSAVCGTAVSQNAGSLARTCAVSFFWMENLISPKQTVAAISSKEEQRDLLGLVLRWRRGHGDEGHHRVQLRPRVPTWRRRRRGGKHKGLRLWLALRLRLRLRL